MTWLLSLSLNVVAAPGLPFGFSIGGLALNVTGALMSAALISSRV
jgi:hypothetical protein